MGVGTCVVGSVRWLGSLMPLGSHSSTGGGGLSSGELVMAAGFNKWPSKFTETGTSPVTLRSLKRKSSREGRSWFGPLKREGAIPHSGQGSQASAY